MKINCITIDDEPLALQKMHDYILRVGYLNLMGEFDNAIEAMEFLINEKVDLIFLDIQMDELSGIQMLETMTVKPKVIFTTAYHEYAIRGYELDVCDYLLKPISFQRFLKACEKAHQVIAGGSNSQSADVLQQTDNKAETYFFVKNGNLTQKINFKDILFVEGMKDYLRIWTKDEKIMTLLSFKKLEEALPADSFVRIHKSYLISIDKIESIERMHVRIANESLAIGDTYRREFFKIIDERKLN
jgi:DNA-binding LytR/AlgR family response regulator